MQTNSDEGQVSVRMVAVVTTANDLTRARVAREAQQRAGALT